MPSAPSKPALHEPPSRTSPTRKKLLYDPTVRRAACISCKLFVGTVTAPTTKAAGFNGFPTEAAQPCGHCPASGPLTRPAGEAGGSASDPRTWRKSRRPRTSHREEACPSEPPTPDRRTGRIPRKTARPSYRGRGPAKPPAERGRPSHVCDRAWAFRPQTL